MRNFRKNLHCLSLVLFSVGLMTATGSFLQAHAKNHPTSKLPITVGYDSPLTDESKAALTKAAHLIRGGHVEAAKPLIANVLNAATDLPKCLAVAKFTEPLGFPLMDVRRQCLSHALTFCHSREDYLQVAMKARQYQCYEVTHDAIDQLVATSTSISDLYDLASKAQEVAMNDVSHLAMEKLYVQIKTVPDALNYVRQAKLLNMEDMMRRAIKDLVDDETDPHALMTLLVNIEPLQLPDLNRYCMKKALERSASVTDYLDLYNAAKRLGQPDIANVAVFRGRKVQAAAQGPVEPGMQQGTTGIGGGGAGGGTSQGGF